MNEPASETGVDEPAANEHSGRGKRNEHQRHADPNGVSFRPGDHTAGQLMFGGADRSALAKPLEVILQGIRSWIAVLGGLGETLLTDALQGPRSTTQWSWRCVEDVGE